MKITEQEKGLLGLFRQVESRRNREDVLFHVQAILKAENALKADYGLVGPEATLFNGAVRDTAFIMPDAGPVMGAQA